MDTDLGIVGDIHGGSSGRVYILSSSPSHLYIIPSILAPLADPGWDRRLRDEERLEHLGIFSPMGNGSNHHTKPMLLGMSKTPNLFGVLGKPPKHTPTPKVSAHL